MTNGHAIPVVALILPVRDELATSLAEEVLSQRDRSPRSPLVVSEPFHGQLLLPTDPYDDLSVMACLLNPRSTGQEQSLANLASDLGIKLSAFDHLHEGMGIEPTGPALVEALMRIFVMLYRHLLHKGLSPVYETLERPLGLVLRRMEATGISVVRTPVDLSAEKPETKRQWSGWPTRFVTATTGRVHPTWCQTSSITGRVTARNPPLQSLPKSLRESVVAPNGRVLVVADYSEADFRVAAGLSGDAALLRMFRKGIDAYSQVGILAGLAARGREREVGKFVALASLYGATPRALADETKLPQSVIESMIAGYQDKFSTLWDWRQEQVESFRAGLEIRNPWGRLLKPTTEAQAINHLCQSSAADVLKTAMLRLQDALPKRAQMVAQIHDELLVECRDKDADAVAKIMREQMTKSIPQLPVTLAVKIGAGKSWAEATANQQ